MPKWWEKEPLRFECQPDCFKCCLKPGIIYFDSEDIRKAADYLDISPSELKKTFLTRDDGEWVLEVGGDGAPWEEVDHRGGAWQWQVQPACSHCSQVGKGRDFTGKELDADYSCVERGAKEATERACS